MNSVDDLVDLALLELSQDQYQLFQINELRGDFDHPIKDLTVTLTGQQKRGMLKRWLTCLRRSPSARLCRIMGLILFEENGTSPKTPWKNIPVTESLRRGGDATIRLWRGDITRLQVGAIVNAANEGMLGCFQPGHTCIDNVIHAHAGPELREDCRQKMLHGHPSGYPMLTRGYHLPCQWIFHVVGPNLTHPPQDGSGIRKPTIKDAQQLSLCYSQVLDLCQEHQIDSVAFCCISTGLFGYPPTDAAHAAISTVRSWIRQHSSTSIHVIFDTFEQRDYDIYARYFSSSR